MLLLAQKRERQAQENQRYTDTFDRRATFLKDQHTRGHADRKPQLPENLNITDFHIANYP